MNQIALRVDNVGKLYRIGRRNTHTTLRDALVEVGSAPLRAWRRALRDSRGAKPENLLWALHDVSFGLSKGEALGIVGRNGAGKSTLLKILARITKPTIGTVSSYGRVGSLLEVGTGFHPELTGRENIYLNGAILGMKRAEIGRKFDEIVAFSEVERFLDTPVKHYSSGMYVRLAFAVAAHLEPEILIVDEVLAVGDAAFQKKCLGRMGDIASEGRTVLFVSHNMPAVEALCPRSIWLQQGRLVADGPTTQVLISYLQATSALSTDQSWPEKSQAPGNSHVRLSRVCIRRLDASAQPLAVNTPLVAQFDYWNEQPDANLDLSLQLFNEQGVLVCDVGRAMRPAWYETCVPQGPLRDVCHIPGDLLNNGRYRLDLFVRKQSELVYHHPDVLVFDVEDTAERRRNWFGQWPGVIRPRFEWTTELM